MNVKESELIRSEENRTKLFLQTENATEKAVVTL
jgi:hypothetical protein